MAAAIPREGGSGDGLSVRSAPARLVKIEQEGHCHRVFQLTEVGNRRHQLMATLLFFGFHDEREALKLVR
jgi:hypothetical protein